MSIFKIACCGLMILGASMSIAKAGEPKLDVHRSAVQDQGADGLYPAQSTKGRFFVNMPIPFNDFSIAVEDDNVGNVVLHGIAGNSSDRYKFSAVETEINSRMKSPDLAGIVNEIATKLGAVTALDVKDQPDGEMVSAWLKANPRSAYMRLFRDKRSFFTVTCEYPAEAQADAAQICGAFVRSFVVNR